MPTQHGTKVTPNAFLHFPKQSSNDQIPTIFFFITGNPGLIGYYHKFLNLLCESRESESSTRPVEVNTSPQLTARPAVSTESCVVAGFSLGGFDVLQPASSTTTTSNSSLLSTKEDETAQSPVSAEQLHELVHPPSFIRANASATTPYALRDQIGLSYARLTTLVSHVHDKYHTSLSTLDNERSSPASLNTVTAQDQNHGPARTPIKVILAGHSVGAHIALEMIRIHHQHTSSSISQSSTQFTIHASLLLTPTIQHIAHSPSGRLATPLLTYLPFLPTMLQLSSTFLSSMLSEAQLRWLVGRVTGMPAGEALDVTVRFLRTRGAVNQALSMARDEMLQIGEMGWGEEVWRATTMTETTTTTGWEGDEDGERKWEVPWLFFWFAGEDHWVARETREEIISALRECFGGDDQKEEMRDGNRKPVVVVDEDEGLVHAWCLTQSELVAARVRVWVGDVLRELGP